MIDFTEKELEDYMLNSLKEEAIKKQREQEFEEKYIKDMQKEKLEEDMIEKSIMRQKPLPFKHLTKLESGASSPQFDEAEAIDKFFKNSIDGKHSSNSFNIKKKNIENENLLHASQKNDLEGIKKALGNGADIEAKYNTGRTALISASAKGEKEIVQLLLDNGADIEANDGTGGNALLDAIIEDNANLEIIKLLIDYGADINAKDEQGINALGAAVHTNKIKIAEFLIIEQNADVNSLGVSGANILADVIQSENIKLIKLLLKHGADMHTENENGMSALSWAMAKKKYEILKLLKEYDPSISVGCAYKIVDIDAEFTNNKKPTDDLETSTVESLSKEDLEYTTHNLSNPQKLVKILNKFTTAKSNLKHTTHNWDMGQREGEWKDINSFLEDIKEDWKEIDKDLKNISPNLHSKIESFLFNHKLGEKNPESTQECIYAWGEYHLKTGWSSPEFIKWCNANPKESPFNYMLEKSKREVIDGVAIDRFSDVINIFKNEIEIRSDKNQLMEIFFNLEGNLPNGINLDINDSLEGVEFYTDVESFKASLVRIFKMMQERENCPHIKVRAEKFVDEGYIELYLTQVASTTHKEPQEIINKMKQEGGDMGYILEKLSSLCDWRIEYPFDNKKSYRINLLDSKTHKITFQEVNPIEGFTHILRFYK